MSFNKKSFALYWEYRINLEVRQVLTNKVKLALLEENWDLFHNQETFVENLPDKAKEALLILDRSGFRTSDVLKYFSDEAEREIMREAENIILPAYEPISCVVEDTEIIINFDWSHPRGQWIICPIDENKQGEFSKIVEKIRVWLINRQADYIKKTAKADEEARKPALSTLTWDILKKSVDWITINFTDYAIFIADNRENAVKKGAHLLKELKDCLQADLFYLNRKNGHRKVLLPNDDYTTRLYNLAAQKNIVQRSDIIFFSL